MWDIKERFYLLIDNAENFHLNHVGYKVLYLLLDDLAQSNFHLNHVGYKAITGKPAGPLVNVFHLNHVGYKGPCFCSHWL